MSYRGRIAPTPTGLLHAGHANTFLTAQQRARDAGGKLLLRIEDLDTPRCKPEFVQAALEDLKWLGITFDEPPIYQSQRREHYLKAWQALKDRGFLYPCSCSRSDVTTAAQAPHEEEALFPVEWRVPTEEALTWDHPKGVNWRFRVPDGRTVVFEDGRLGRIERVAGRDFGDFIVWNRDDIPAYELAVVVDDFVMQISEVVRGEDLLTSTARQILIAEALEFTSPSFYHCPLVMDENGKRLAKRHASLSLQTLRSQGVHPEDLADGRFTLD